MPFLLMLCLVAPSAGAPASAAVGSTAKAKTMLSDSAIEQDLRARLARSKLAARKFQFRVQGGVATLSGRTDVIQHKGIMTRMARSAGARGVVNHIEISEAARAKAAERLESGRRKALVRHQPAAGPPPSGGR
jgi:hypothetical protein